MKPKVSLNRLINSTIQDPELKQLFLSTPDLVALQDEIRKQFQLYEEQIVRYQERLRFNLKDTHTKNGDDEKELKTLTYKAYHDSLTGLPNRTYLYERIEAAIMQAHRSANPFAIMFIDLDGFKTINDNYGHDFGDKMLQVVADRLIEFTRETDMVARLAGDEFCVHLMNMETAAQSARVADAIIKGFKKPIQLDDVEFVINLSIGISHYPMDGQTTKQLMKNADVAMYEAKKRGTNLFQFYEHRLTERVNERLEFEKDILVAITEQQIALSFQPYLDLESGHMAALDTGMEWQHGIRGKIDSTLFYKGVSNSHILMRLLQWQVMECCRLQRNWQMRGYPVVTMRVFIDSKQFLHKELFKYLAKGLGETSTTDVDIELVITESSLYSQPELSKRILVQANKLGFKTGINFTTSGFLPITSLQDSGIHSLSIANESLAPLNNEQVQVELLQGINSLCNAINIKLLVSGIVNENQKRLYLKHGIQTLSGSHFSEQQKEDDFEVVLKRFKETSIQQGASEQFNKTG